MANQQQLITQLARRYGVDPRAALAIASVEGGFHGSVGDQGTSFGPFQLHEGGALPHGRGAQWANSQAGINYAMQHIAGVSRGLRGRQAVSAISSRFERPANVPGEIAKAMSRYGNVGSAGGMPAMMGNAGIQGGGSGDVSSAIASLIQNVLANNAAMRQHQTPQLNPQAVRYGLNS
jgi:hypothetical protein